MVKVGLHGVADGAVHGVVVAKNQRVVHVADYIDRVVAEITTNALHGLGKVGEVQAIGGEPESSRDRCVALDAEIPELSVRFALSTSIHG